MSDYKELVKSLREADEISMCGECGYKGDKKGMLFAKAADAIEELSKPRWISVKERLPEEGNIVLCSTWSCVFCGYANSRGLFYVANNTMYDAWTWEPGVTHWMPLPEPPEEARDA